MPWFGLAVFESGNGGSVPLMISSKGLHVSKRGTVRGWPWRKTPGPPHQTSGFAPQGPMRPAPTPAPTGCPTATQGSQSADVSHCLLDEG